MLGMLGVNNATIEGWYSNNTVILICNKILKFSFWLLFGIYSYLNLLPQGLKLRINKLSFIELFLILYTIFICLVLIETSVLNYMALGNDVITHFHSLGAEAPLNPLPAGVSGEEGNSQASNSNFLNRASDGAIMTTPPAGAGAVAGGFKLAQKAPSTAGKVAAVAGGIAAGASAIVVKNLANNVSSDLGKPNKFISNNDLINVLNDMFNLTGNNGLDLLNMIHFIQGLQLMFVIIITYNFLLSRVNETAVEKWLGKFLPLIIVRFYVRSINYFKKSSFIILICLLFILLVLSYLSYYYLGFFINNLDGIINLYFKK